MADTKISDMSAATEVDNVDVFPLVQGGVNKKALRSQVLTAGATEDITLQAAAGQSALLRGDGGTGIVKVDGTGDVFVQSPGHNVQLQYDPTAPDWNGAPPNTVKKALDRCASLLKALNGGVGP